MKYKNFINPLVISAFTSALLIGCSSGSGSSTTSTSVTLDGTAVDPELQGATVFLDANGNGIFDSGELNTKTDSLGNYSLSISSDDVGKAIIVTGGIDKVTKEKFVGKLSAISSSTLTSQNITPLTTLVEKYKSANPSKSLDTVKSELASKLSLPSASDLDKNVVEEVSLLKVALRIHKVTQNVATSGNQDILKIYETLATQLTEDSNLSAAITSTISREITSGTLDEAKIKDLDLELQNISDNFSAKALALTAANVEEKIQSATNETELDADLTQDTSVVVEDNEVNQAQGTRTLEQLGLNGLDQNTQDSILKSDLIDIDNDSIEEIQAKLDNNELDLDANQEREIKREQFFNDAGLNDLDDDTKNNLGARLDDANFDYATSSKDDFRNELNNPDFYDNDDDLRAKIQGEINRESFERDRDSTISSIADGKLIVGSIIKGPIDGATIKLIDADGTLITSTISKNGIFALPQTDLTSSSYTIESVEGSYNDEATNTQVTMSSTQGLKTYFTKDELTAILADKKYIALTPETTIYADLVQSGMPTGEAKAIITSTMITTTSPLSLGESNDVFLLTGDFTTPFPKDQSEAFARNRAISLSYMLKDLNQSANKVFDVIGLITDDLKDSTANGIDIDTDGTIDTNVTSAFGLSRAKLFQDTTTKLINGELSDGQKKQLEQMGIDTDRFSNTQSADDANLTAEVEKYLASETLPTLRTLPLLADEDGNTTDAKATYTLTANTDVNVTIQTPTGDWITPMWRYNNNPLPVVIRTNRDDNMTLEFVNNLAADSTIHWHGFKIPAHMDGGPDVPVAKDTNKTYSFKMQQPAASLWFHPHPDMETGKQVYMGLAGVFLLEDTITKTLELNNELPSGDKDTILLVQDRRFSAEQNGVRELKYKDMAMDSDGMLGDTLLVNGSVVPKQEVSNTLHRYRLYNVSNARSYDFALSDGSKFKVIGTDGGLLNTPTEVDHITLGAAERVEIVIDFSKYNIGDKVMLISRPMAGDMMSMMSGMNGDTMTTMDGMNGDTMTTMDGMTGRIANGAGLSVMRFDITAQETETISLYSNLPSNAEVNTRLTEDDVTVQGYEREFVMSMSMGSGGMDGMGSGGMDGMSFVINGKSFDATRVDEYITSGATEIWSIKNMSPMTHPFHAHAIQYQILDRNGVPASGTDLGWKDTFLVQPGETVRIIGKFDGTINYGDYMYHCHILEHEDAGMMGYFRIGDTGNLDNK